jgi:hypothetical protein
MPLVEWGALVVVLGLLFARATSPDPRIGDDDFGVFFAGAAAIAGRHSPYDGDFVSPPWFALALVPFTLLPLPAARAIWLGLNLGLLLVASALASRLVGLEWPIRRVFLVGALTGLIPAVEFGLHLGQNSLLVWVLVLAALLFAADGWFAPTGMLLSLALLKPHIVWLFALGTAVLAWRQRSLRTLLGASALTLVVLAAASGVVAPDSYADLLSLRPRTWDYWGSTLALPAFLAWLSGAQWLGVLLYLPAALLGGAAVARLWDRRAPQSLPYAASLTACATLALAPYAYSYDAVLLNLPLLWILVRARHAKDRAVQASVVILATAVLAVAALERPADYSATRFFGLLAPLLVLAAVWLLRRQTPSAE